MATAVDPRGNRDWAPYAIGLALAALGIAPALPRDADGMVRKEILQLIAMNQVDLIEPHPDPSPVSSRLWSARFTGDASVNEYLDRYGRMLTGLAIEDMYRIMAIANYEDRFVIPSTHREYAENTFDVRGGCGFSFGNGCSDGASKTSLFGGTKKRTIPIKAKV